MFLRFWFFTCCPHSFSFGTSLFIKRPYASLHFILLESIFEHIRQKLIKNMLILKFRPGMKCLHVFFSFFHPGMKCHPCLSSRDEISSRQKRVNSKRHFTIDRHDFIPGWNFTCKHPLSLKYLFHFLQEYWRVTS